jgi:hypothetical protein
MAIDLPNLEPVSAEAFANETYQSIKENLPCLLFNVLPLVRPCN